MFWTFAWALNASAASIPLSERNALIGVYNSTGGGAWRERSGWLGPEGTECGWFGVRCDDDGGHVVALNLGYNNLAGTFPAAVLSLPHLTSLSLGGNRLSGAIPSSLTQLIHLRSLSLHDNELKGTLQPFLGLVNLEELDLENNELTGGIPSLSGLARLRVFNAWNNHFTGPIPPLAGMTNLEVFQVSKNQLTGGIPSLSGLSNLAVLSLDDNQLSGAIPPLTGLTKLFKLALSNNRLSGNIPPLTGLPALEELWLENNQLTGSIPPLGNLRDVRLDDNRLTGGIPSISGMQRLRTFSAARNELTGSIPSLAALPSLLHLVLRRNHLTGSIPSVNGAPNLLVLFLDGNALSGPIPSSLAGAQSLYNNFGLDIRFNALYSTSSGLTAFLNAKQAGGDWMSTQTVAPANVAVTAGAAGAVTVSWAPIAYVSHPGFYRVHYATSKGGPYTAFATTANKSAKSLQVSGLAPGVAYYFVVRTTTEAHPFNPNTLVSDASTEVAFTTPAEASPRILSFLADPPAILSGQSTRLRWTTEGATSVTLDRNAVERSGSLSVSPSETTVYTLTASAGTVSVTRTTTVVVSDPSEDSFEAVPEVIRQGQTAVLVWDIKGVAEVRIDQGVGSHLTGIGHAAVAPQVSTIYTLTATRGGTRVVEFTEVVVIREARISATTLAPPMFQPPGVGGATTKYVLNNSGGAPATVRLAQEGDFFSQSPSTFDLEPGASQVVSVTGLPRVAGVFEGRSIPSGAGVPADVRIPIRLLSIASPSAPSQLRPAAHFVHTWTGSGSAAFTNAGNAAVTGFVASDAPWLVPQSGSVTIPAGTTLSVAFSIDRLKRPDAGALLGSRAATLSFDHSSGGSRATVVDTVRPVVTTSAPPPLRSGEVALFVPGAGHVTGTVGVFLSDVTLFSRQSDNDVQLFFTPIGSPQSAARSATLPTLPAGRSVTFADVASSIFGSEGQVGSLQIRASDTERLSVTTNIFNASNPRGTYGTAIPTFRSDRAAAVGEQIVLTGLRRDAASHTNLFIQETQGIGATVDCEFFAADGTSRGIRRDEVGPFALLQINNVVPEGAVSAILTNRGSPAGRVMAYATPLDDASGDNWSIVDGSRQYHYAGSDPVIVPVAGTLRGANATFFRTDLAIMNRGATPGTGTLRFIARGGEILDRPIVLGPRQTTILNDVIGTLFGITTDVVGYLLFTPSNGMFALTSRTYTTLEGQPATFGTGVPALPASAALKTGSVRTIAALDDAALATVVAAAPATFRTNLGLLETSGNHATVRLTLRSPAGSASRDYSLAPRQFLLLGGIASEILGDARHAYGDLRDLEVSVQVIDGTGSVLYFTSSVDNGTGDSILRTE